MAVIQEDRTKSEQISFQVDPGLIPGLRRYQEVHELRSLSEAARTLMTVALVDWVLVEQRIQESSPDDPR